MKPRIYIDTSVIGGCWDDAFAAESQALFDMARRGEIILLLSDLLVEELSEAPEHVRGLYESLPRQAIERLTANEESLHLRDAYLAAGILGPASADDAHHVALATIAKADLIVSWNFKHIVHVDKIKLFAAVNLTHGYGLIDIRSPLEVV